MSDQRFIGQHAPTDDQQRHSAAVQWEQNSMPIGYRKEFDILRWERELDPLWSVRVEVRGKDGIEAVVRLDSWGGGVCGRCTSLGVPSEKCSHVKAALRWKLRKFPNHV